MRSSPFIFIPLHYPTLYSPRFHPDSMHYHSYSPHSHPQSPHSHPDFPHSHPDSLHSRHSHHSIPQFLIRASTDCQIIWTCWSQEFKCKISTQFELLFRLIAKYHFMNFFRQKLSERIVLSK